MSGFSLADWEASLGNAVSIDDINMGKPQAEKSKDDFVELETNKIYRVKLMTAKVISKNEVTKVQATMHVLKGGEPAGLTTIWAELPFQAKDAKLSQENVIKITGMRLNTLGTILGLTDKHDIVNAASELHDKVGQKLSADELNSADLFLVKVPQPGSDKYFYTNLTSYAPTKKYGFAEGAEMGSEEAPF
jgi:hypothetical protein